MKDTSDRETMLYWRWLGGSFGWCFWGFFVGFLLGVGDVV